MITFDKVTLMKIVPQMLVNSKKVFKEVPDINKKQQALLEFEKGIHWFKYWIESDIDLFLL